MHQHTKSLLKEVQMISEIACFLYFPDGNWPCCWIFKSINFICRHGWEDRRTSPYQIFSKLDYPSRTYCNFFKFSKCLLPALSWIFKIAKFYWLFGWRRSRRISTPNFVKIGQSVVKVIRFFVFFKMSAATILNCRIREILIADAVWRSIPITVPNFVINCFFRYRDIAFFEFLRWPPLPFGISKSRNFIGHWGGEGRDASAGQILSKSVNWLQRY